MHILRNLLLVISLASFGLVGFWLWQRYSPSRLSFSQSPVPTQLSVSISTPVSLSIPDLAINDLPIYSMGMTGNRWPTRSDGVVHLKSTVLPGQFGNSVIYAHNWRNLFGPLVNILPGTKVTIKDSNGKYQVFVIASTAVVGANQVEVIENSADTRLTLYTCTGFLDSKRFVAVAFPI